MLYQTVLIIFVWENKEIMVICSYTHKPEHLQSPPWQSHPVVQSPLSLESEGWSEGVMCRGENMEAAPAHTLQIDLHSNDVIAE